VGNRTAYIAMKVLPHPSSQQPLWDAGRIVPAGVSEEFEFSGIDPRRPLRLVVRAAPAATTSLRITIDERAAGTLEFVEGDRWVELATPPFHSESSRVRVRFEPSSAERVNYHVFLLQAP
jgi:hypothetical protein